jgi:hypothetical protein
MMDIAYIGVIALFSLLTGGLMRLCTPPEENKHRGSS